MSKSIYSEAITEGLLAAIKDIAGPDTLNVSFDYIVENHGSITVLDPTSREALNWLCEHLPDDCPRWGRVGFAVESNYVADILEGMREAGLYSESEYVRKMAGHSCAWCGADNASLVYPTGPETSAHFCNERCVRTYTSRCPFEGDRDPLGEVSESRMLDEEQRARQ